jgi:hypothetical protein
MTCECGAQIHPARYALGYLTCLTCGEQAARRKKHTVIPLHKQGYMAFSGADALAVVKQINPRRTT